MAAQVELLFNVTLDVFDKQNKFVVSDSTSAVGGMRNVSTEWIYIVLIEDCG